VNLLKKLFNKHKREVKRLWPTVDEINAVYETLHDLPDDEVQGKTEEFRRRLAEGETLDDLMVEAYAVVKEACRRFAERKISWDVVGNPTTWDMVPFDVQLVGAVVLHQGKIAEMATGEGKTLVAIMPLYLNALEGKGAHLVTVNDYLARRDASWNGPIYHWLGISVAVLQDPNANNGIESYRVSWDEERGYHLLPISRPEAYACDITYGRQDQFGFDYLYDNMAWDVKDIRHRGFHYAIVDEADQLLIDEARTPLIISGQVPESRSNLYKDLKPIVEHLVRDQSHVVARLVDEGEKLWNDGETYEAGVKLLQAQRGAPKQRKLMKLREDVAVQKEVFRVEMDYMRDKQLSTLDEEALLYTIDEKQHVAELTERGRSTLSPSQQEEFILPNLSEDLHAIENDETLTREQKEQLTEQAYRDYAFVADRIHAVSNLIRSYSLFERDVNYVVQEDKVIIVDEFTGRLQPGRRYSEGLHQALEAKENVTIERDTQTIATITVQNYFRMYDKLAGMTGTAETEEDEFWGVYKLDVVVIPTNRPVRRIDLDDIIFRTKREKYNAVVDEVVELHEKQTPVLIGTRSVEVSELLSRLLQRKSIPHAVLNAKNHQREAEIIAKAGQPGAVTIATNMAGRGTDIKIPPGLVACGKCKLFNNLPDDTPTTDDMTVGDCEQGAPCGLHIVGTERHDARRIDRQLRGRSGRQGDPGSSQFFISLEDDLMRLFGSDRISSLMDRLGAKEGEVIQSPMVTKAIERAQKRVEMNNFDIRKRLLDYDDVMNQQREVIYDRRRYALDHEDLHQEIQDMTDAAVDDLIARHTGEDVPPEEWNVDGLKMELSKIFGVEVDALTPSEESPDGELTPAVVRERIMNAIADRYEARCTELRREARRQGLEDENTYVNRLEKIAILSTIDDRWRVHLTDIDDLKGGIHLRAYGQKDPVVEFKREAFDMFETMIGEIDRQTLEFVFKSPLPSEREVEARRAEAERLRRQAEHEDGDGAGSEEPVLVGMEPQVRTVGGRGARKPVTTKATRAAAPRTHQPVTVAQKVGRNDPCPCGSGKKYKHCHGAAH